MFLVRIGQNGIGSGIEEGARIDFDGTAGGNDPGTGIFPAQPEDLAAAFGFSFSSHRTGVDHDQFDRHSRIITQSIPRLRQPRRQQSCISVVEAASEGDDPCLGMGHGNLSLFAPVKSAGGAAFDALAAIFTCQRQTGVESGSDHGLETAFLQRKQ